MIGQKVSRSAAFMAAAQLLAKGLDFLAVLIVARFLTPEDFGLVALATSVMLIAASMTEVPVVEALIRNEKLTRDDIDSAFTLTVLRGLLIVALLIASAAPLAAFFEDPRLEMIILVMAIGPLVQGFSSPNMVHAMKAVDYSPLARSQLLGKIASFFAILILAWASGTYWALVAGLIANPVVAAISTHIIAPYRPRFAFRGIPAIFGFAGWVTLSRMIFTLNQQMDRFFVGAILGKPQLGQYAMAGDLSSMATYVLAAPVSQPLFAGFSTMTADPARLRDSYLRGQQIMLAVIAPVGFLFAAVAQQFIPLALGDAWAPAIPIIWWLAPAIALQVLTIPTQALIMAAGRTPILVMREGLSLLLRLPATLLAAWAFGLVEAAAARSLASGVMIIVMLFAANRLVGASVRQQLFGCWRIFLALALMTFGVIALEQLLPDPISPGLKFLELAGLCTFGVGVYVLALFGAWKIRGFPHGAESWIYEKTFGRLRK